MTSLAFFLAGLPVAYIVERAIAALSAPPDEEDVEDEWLEAGSTGRPAAEPLPWQHDPWPSRLGIALGLLAPPLMAIAGGRFPALEAACISVLIVSLLVCTGTDLVRFRVPNVITYSATLLALLAATFLPDGEPVTAVLSSGLAALAFLFIAILTRGGLGLGDVKLAMLIGAALGFPGSYHALFIGVCGGGVAIAVLFFAGVVSRKQAVPYAPFLAAAAIGVALVSGTSFAAV